MVHLADKFGGLGLSQSPWFAVSEKLMRERKHNTLSVKELSELTRIRKTPTSHMRSWDPLSDSDEGKGRGGGVLQTSLLGTSFPPAAGKAAQDSTKLESTTVPVILETSRT